jgi:hypothetical protein
LWLGLAGFDLGRLIVDHRGVFPSEQPSTSYEVLAALVAELLSVIRRGDGGAGQRRSV